MNLPEALSKQKDKFLQAVPPQTAAVMQDAIDDLSNSSILKNCLKKGETAPDFTLEDSSDKSFTLYDILAEGPVILKFFRGDW